MKKIIKTIVAVSFLALVCVCVFLCSTNLGSSSTTSNSTSISQITCTDSTPSTPNVNLEDVELI